MPKEDWAILRKFLKILCAFNLLFFVFSFSAQECAVIYQKGIQLYDEVYENLSKKITIKSLIPIEKDKEEDAQIKLTSEKDSLVCALGPKAIKAAFQAQCQNIIAVGIPNPLSKIYSQAKGATFISLYPDVKTIVDYFSKTNSAKSFGIVFTNSVNYEMADYFKKEIEGLVFKCKLLGVDKAQDLASEFPLFLGFVDVTFVLIDPLAFNNEAVKFIVTKAIEKKKIVCSFTEQVPSSGIPIALFVPSSSLAETISKALKEGTKGGKPYFSPDFSISINEQAMITIGANYDGKKVKTKF